MLSDEEAEKLSKIMYGDKPNSKIEAPDEDEEKKKRDAYYEELQSIMYNKTGSQTQGKQLAEQAGAFLDGIKDRDTLMQYYDAYSQDLNQSIQNKDTVNAYKNQYLLNKVADKLGREANVATYLSDLGSEIKGNILENVAGKINFVAGTYADRGENTIDANSLYKIATSSDGKYKNTSEQRNYDMVINLLNSHPDDKNIVELASLVQSGNFKGEKEKIKLLTDYANSVTKTEEFQRFEQAHTADEKRYLENLKRKETLSNYGTLPQLGLNAVGTVSNMAPDIGLAYGTGAALGIKNNSVIGNISKIGMSATKAGSQLSDTLSQGNDFSKSMEFSILSGLNEYVWESIGGDFVNAAISGGVNATPAGKVIQGLLDNGNVKSNIAKAVILHAAGVNEEGFEEVFTDLTDAFLRSQILSDNSDWENIGESLVNSYVQSILPTLMLGGFGQVQVNREINTQEKVIKNEINASDFLSKQQKDELIKGVENAAKSAKMGLTDNWTKAKKEVYNSLSEAQKNSLENGLFNDKRRNDILNFAKNLDEADKAIKEQQIINHAKEIGISEASLRQMFGGEELVFPYSYSQARETVERLNAAQTSVQNQLNQQAAKEAIGTVLNANAQPTPQPTPQPAPQPEPQPVQQEDTIRPPEDFEGTEYEWLEQYFGKESDKSGVERLVVRNSLPDVENGKIFGTYTTEEEISPEELNNSPVMLAIYSLDPNNSHGINESYVFYKNLKDAIKDINARYDGVDGLEEATNDDYELVSVAGKGKFTYSLNTDEWIASSLPKPKIVPIPKRLQRQLKVHTTPLKLGKPFGKTLKKAAKNSQARNKPSGVKSLQDFANKYGTLKTKNINGKDITYVEVTKTGAKSPFVDYFRYYNPESDNATFKDKTQEELNNEPIATIFHTGMGNYNGYIFGNLEDFLNYKSNQFPKTVEWFVLARNASPNGNFKLDEENGEWVWRSDLTGKKVRFEHAPSTQQSPVGTYISAFKKPLETVRHIDFRGSTFSSAGELANILQKAIDPTGETYRYIFSKKVGQKEEIVGQETITYNLPGTTARDNNTSIMLDYIANKARALGADYVYSMHNHPGHSRPSGSKRGQTNDYGSAKTVKDGLNRRFAYDGSKIKYGGALVEGLDDYSFFYGGSRKGFKETIRSNYENGYKYDGLKTDSWTKQPIYSANDVEYVAKELAPQRGYSRIVLVDADNHPRAILNVKNEVFENGTSSINRTLLDLARDYGALYAGIVTDDPVVYAEARVARIAYGKNTSTSQKFGSESKEKMIGYGIGPKSTSYLTPSGEQVDNEKYIGRDAIKETKQEKKPAKRLEKKRATQKSLTDVYNEKKSNPFKRTETSKNIEKSDDVLMDLIPTGMEKKNSGIEQAIKEIENGTRERELGRARTSLATIYRYINKVMNGRTGKLRGPEARRAYGIWKGKTHWIRTREKSNVSTWFHELGHEINDTVLNMTALKKAFGSYVGLENELNTLCEKAFGKIYNKKPDTKLQEGFAEAVREFIENPEKFATTNPAISKLFADMSATSEGFAEMMVHMKALSEMSKDYINDTPEGRVMSNIDMQNEGSEKVYHDNWITRGVTKIVENFFNDLVYGTKFDRQVAKLQGIKYRDMLSSQKLEDLMRTKGNADAILRQLARGYYDDYGNKLTYGLTEIVEGVMPTREQAKAKGMSLQDARVERMNELAAYGVALRELTLLTTRAKKGEDFKVGQRINDLKETIKKYRADAQLNEAMSKINDNSKAIINIAVNEGLISATVGKQILEDNILYFPLNRVMEDRVTSALGLSKDGSTGKSFYRLKGSDLQIQNPLISLMGNWGRILYNIDYNNMLKTMVRTAYDVGNLGDWFDIKVAPKMDYRGTVSLDVFKSAIKDDLSATTRALGMNLPVEGIVDSMNLDAMYSLFVPAKSDPGEMMLTYLDNGVRKTIQFANNELGRGLYNTITNLDAKNSQLWLNIMNKLNQPLRLGATVWNIEFALSNIQSDAIQRFLYSSGNAFYIPIATSVWNVARYINSRYGDKLPWGTEEGAEMYEKFMRSKASQSGTFRGDQVWLRDNAKEVFGYTEQQLFGKKRISSAGEFVENFEKKFGSVAEKLGYVSEVSEQATRFAEFCMVYKQMKARGFTEAEAVREAGMKARQVTQDFTTQGKLMREINKLIPFASATAGGLYRFGQEIRNQPVRLTVRLSMLLALAAVLEGLMDGEDREYYEEINKQKRFDNFFLKNPAGDKQHPIIIKKPQGPARYLINFVQLITNASLGRIPEDKVVDELYDWLAMSVEDQLPATRAEDFLPTVLKAMVENSVNKDFYYGNPIVPKDLEKLDPKNQYDEYTSELAKAVGNVFNWSPLKVDNVLKTWFAGAGKRVLDTADSIIRGGKENQEASLDISERFGTSKMFGNAFRSSESVNEVYDRVEELEREEAEGRLTDAEERELANLKEAQSALTQINKKIKAVNSNPKLSANEKRDEIDKLREQRTDAARYYLGKTPLNAKNIDTIEKLSFYPSSSSYTYSVGSGKAKKKYTFEVTDEMQEEYATYFKKEYERDLATLKNTAAYQRSTEQEKLELEKKTKSSARTSATNYMKKKAAAKKLGQ